MPASLLPAATDVVLPTAVRAQGLRIWDSDGKEYLDACGGAMVMALGHRHPRLVEAAHRQLERLTFTYRFSFGNEPQQQLSEVLRSVAPMPQASAFFNSSGSESVESAIQAALVYWQRRGRPEKTQLLSRYPGFHGSTTGALALSGSKWRAAFDHLLAPNAVVEAPGADIRARRDATESLSHGIAQWEAAIAAVGAERVAAIFLEPITGASGAAVVPPDGYLPAVRELCDRHEILLIADETITGFGRTGRWWGTQHWDTAPDITTFAKGVTSGVIPFSGLLMAEHVAETLIDGGGFPYGHTFSGYPLGCAVALEAVRVIQDEDLVSASAHNGARLREQLSAALCESPVVGEIRGAGLLIGIELVTDRETLQPKEDGAAGLQRLARDQGLLIYACSTPLPSTTVEAVLLAPPLNSTPAELDDIAERLVAAVARL